MTTAAATCVLQALLSLSPAPDAAVPVWVFLADDRPQPASIADTALTPRALARRALRRTIPGLFDRNDVPIAAQSVAMVEATGARIRTQSRWMCAVSAWATPGQQAALRAMPGVTHVEPVGRGRAAWQGEPVEAIDGTRAPRTDYGYATAQITQISLQRMHDRGFRGNGIVIGILDTGFHRAHEAFLNPAHPVNVLAEHDFVNNDGNTDIEASDPAEQHWHGTWILGTIGAYMPGAMVGGAWEASFVLAKTEVVPSETPIEEDYYVAGLEFVEANGADVATSSLGYIDWYTQADLDGRTAVTTKGVNIATDNGVVCLTAAGNEGHDADPHTSTLIAPADAPDVITCGAAWSNGAIASFSSSGPTADGRLKPEVLACGVYTASVHSTDATGYQSVSGTSLSTPLVAAATACILQARPDYGVDAIREALFATASRSDASGLHPDPAFVEGHGVIDAYRAAVRGRPTADMNLDGHVNGADLGLILGAWGPVTPGTAHADLNGDGFVNGADLGLLLGQWG